MYKINLFVAACTVFLVSFINNGLVLAEDSPSEQAKAIIAKNDFNKDGKLQKNEVDLRFRLRRFAQVDKNSDGTLDLAELTESYENSAKMRQTDSR